MLAQRIAVFDVGKTHARLLIVAGASGELLWQRECDSHNIVGAACRELGVSKLESWLLSTLAEYPERHRVDAIVPVAHGAAAVLLDAAGTVLAAPDYEDPIFDSVADRYRPLRDPYAFSCSPELPLGLNLGRQWFYLQEQHSALFARAAQILLYPQYWAWRLSGNAASEWSSLGSHTDLWRPQTRTWSQLAMAQRWQQRLPPIKAASDVLGPVRPEIAAATGLPAHCQVRCGVHDSNASYLCHLATRSPTEPFAVISSGTWTVIMARGTDLSRLRESQDMLANVDVHGSPTATARFMGGREYATIAAGDDADADVKATWDDVATLLRLPCFAWPAFSATGGPFAGRAGHIETPRELSGRERVALATLYIALMCDMQLDALGAAGTIIVDGPLARSPLFAPLLAALRPGCMIEIAAAASGALAAARLLCGYRALASTQRAVAAPLDQALLTRYAAAWHRH